MIGRAALSRLWVMVREVAGRSHVVESVAVFAVVAFRGEVLAGAFFSAATAPIAHSRTREARNLMMCLQSSCFMSYRPAGSHRHTLPNGLAVTTLRIPPDTVPAGELSPG